MKWERNKDTTYGLYEDGDIFAHFSFWRASERKCLNACRRRGYYLHYRLNKGYRFSPEAVWSWEIGPFKTVKSARDFVDSKWKEYNENRHRDKAP